MGFFDFFKHDTPSPFNPFDSNRGSSSSFESRNRFVHGSGGSKFINHCGGNTWMDTNGHFNVRTGSNTWMDMNDGDIFFG